MNVTAAPAGTRDSSPRPRPYLAIAFVAICIALAGFWPTYFGKMVDLAPDSRWYIHIHAAVMSGWLVIFTLQAWLVANHHLRLHRKFGSILVPYGILVFLVGWMTAVLAFRDRIPTDGFTAASRGLYVPFTDVLFFLPVLLAAWAYRRRPEVHKRLMVVATTILLIAAAHRLVVHTVGTPPPLYWVLPLWLSPILLGISVDWARSRRAHPIYLLGIGLILLMKFRPQLQHTEAWMSFAKLLADWTA